MAVNVHAEPQINPWRSVGFWMAGLLALSQLVNVGRAILDPADFAAYLGLPLASAADAALIHVYALRTAFIGMFAMLLILRRDFVTLKWFALLAVVLTAGIGRTGANTSSGNGMALVRLCTADLAMR